MTGYLWASLVYSYAAGTFVTESVGRLVRWVVA